MQIKVFEKIKAGVFVLLVLFLAGQGLAAADIADAGPAQKTVFDAAFPEELYSESISVGRWEGLQTAVALDLRAMDVVDTIRFLARQADVNVVVTKNVAGRITLFLQNVTVADALDIIIITNNLARKDSGNIITIMTEEEYAQLYGEKYTSMKDMATVSLKYIAGQQAKTMLDNIKSDIGTVVVDDLTGTLVLIDTPKKLREMENLLSKIDIPSIERIIPTVTEEFELSYAKAGELKAVLSEALTDKIGTMRVDERTNKILISDLAHNMEKIRNLVRAFDAKTKKVFIEAKIIEVTLGDEYSFGVEWQKVFSELDKLKNVTFAGTFPFTPVGNSSMAVDVGLLGSEEYTAALQFIKTVGKTRILSSPQISVVNNEEAKFMVGTREAYVTQTISQGDVTTTIAENVEFIDVGVTLFVRPTINKDGFVRMSIKPEISSIRDWLETTEGNKIPIVETSNLETNVLVENGKTVILAGFIKETDTKSVSKVPLLGDIPFLGNLFKSTSNKYEKKELVIFLTPRVVSEEDDLSYLMPETKPRKPSK